MKLRRQTRFHGLKRPKLRQTWNKYNIYNIAHLKNTRIDVGSDTFFQQKWKAKAMTRAYHGEHVSEHKWARLFSRRLQSVVPMDPKYMARTDGATEAQGRGSGLQMKTAEQLGDERREQLEEGVDMMTGFGEPDRKYTPYMNMTYAPLEKRLDTVLFRAMFASSARQARNFVIHGHVKVNGIKVDKPAYRLNPGDMFQVNPEIVMYATGVQRGQGVQPSPYPVSAQAFSGLGPKRRPSAYLPGHAPANLDRMRKGEMAQVEAEVAAEAEAEKTPEERTKDQQKKLKTLIDSAKSLLNMHQDDMNATKKRRVRAWREEARLLLQKSQVAAKRGQLSDGEIMDELVDFLGSGGNRDGISVTDIKEGVTVEAKAAAEAQKQEEKEKKAKVKADEKAKKETDKKLAIVAPEVAALSDEQRTMLQEMLAQEAQDREEERKAVAAAAAAEAAAQKEKEEKEGGGGKKKIKAKKPPYQTPWRPRPWMAAFAIIPRYLEVNPNICAAVYLRHPVARPGRAEVLSPFPEYVNSLAFNYYLRRR